MVVAQEITKPVVGRFAPSPSGRMHAGNIASALMTWLYAQYNEGTIVLRIEDLDQSRSRTEYADALMYDFERLGLWWDKGPLYQSGRNRAYEKNYLQLIKRGEVYPCFCSRADLKAASAPHAGEHAVYTQTCKYLSEEEIRVRAQKRKPAMRLAVPDSMVTVDDLFQGQFISNLALQCGDSIIKRADGGFAYHLAVVVDDASEGVNLVSRGYDLLASTPFQVYLHSLLGFDIPQYAHIPLLVDLEGRRLSKRNKDASLEEMIAQYHSPQGVIGHIAWLYGLLPQDEPISPNGLLQSVTYSDFMSALTGKTTVVWQP